MNAVLVVMHGLTNNRHIFGRIARWHWTSCDSHEWHSLPYLLDQDGRQIADYRWPAQAVACIGGPDFTCPVHRREVIAL